MNYIYSIKGKINYIINLKFELVSVLQAIGIPKAEWLYKDTDYFNMLAQEIDLTNKEVNKFIEYLKNHLYFSALAEIMNSVNDNEYDLQYLAKECNKDIGTLKIAIDLMENFFNTLNMPYLYAKYQNFYLKNLGKICEYYDKFNLNTICDFYNNYENTLNFNVSFISGNFGTRYKNNLFCTIKFPMEKLNCILKKEKISFIFHEFSHPFVKKIIDRYSNQLNFVNKHEDLVYNDKLYQYHTPFGLFEEVIVRSNECYLAVDDLELEKLQIYINKQKKLNIFYFQDLVNLLFQKYSLYNNYEIFFLKEIIPFYQQIVSNDIK